MKTENQLLLCRQPTTTAAKIESSALLGGRREAIIVHRGEEYRLRITRQEKLILTK
jgi:hemin uptake protein HemP